ncbi:hypothetical protein XENTR_v10015073 [Xenopus tropicalis]|nr:hypothetical protein XENTR_v10015073 [Xenopus tropicalis]
MNRSAAGLSRWTSYPELLVSHVGVNDMGVMGQRNLVRAMKQDVDRLRSLISGVVIVWSEMSVPLGAFKGAGAEKKGQRAHPAVEGNTAQQAAAVGTLEAPGQPSTNDIIGTTRELIDTMNDILRQHRDIIAAVKDVHKNVAHLKEEFAKIKAEVSKGSINPLGLANITKRGFF